MFGYVIPDKPNTLIKDYQTYRCYYCGLCKAIGKRTGQCMRMTLNYDIVLLALLAYNYENVEPEFKTGKCPTHWIKGVEYVENTEILARISDINTILGYFKVVDDVIDEHRHGGIRNLVKPYFKKAKQRLPIFAERIEKGYEKLREKEKENKDAGAISEIFGEMLMAAGDAVTTHCDGLLREFLFYLGKWIYVIDATDDLEEDSKKHNFNPFLRVNQSYNDKLWEETEKEARIILYESIEKIKECYNKMKITISEGALSNIVYLGLKARTEQILGKRGQKCKKNHL